MDTKEKMTKRWIGHIEHWHIIAAFLALYDFMAICASYFLALWIRFDGTYSQIETRYIQAYTKFILPCAAVSLVVFFLFRISFYKFHHLF